MNCIDFRREALVQPLRLAAAAGDHAAGCETCGPFLARLREMDAELHQAMSIAVPDGLAERVLVAHGTRRGRAPWGWAIAASVLLVAGLAWVAPGMFFGRTLAGEAIAHVIHEPQSFRLVSDHSEGMLPKELAAQGVRLARELGRVTYATLCPTSAGKAQHLVVSTAAGPVTLLLFPSDSTRRRRAVVEADGYAAITLPAARGSIAIVAASRAQALAIESSLVLS
jgi:hypothetical protein